MLGRQWSESHEDNSSRRGKKGAEQSTDDILGIPLEGEKTEPTPRGKEHPEKSPDDTNIESVKIEKTDSKPPAD